MNAYRKIIGVCLAIGTVTTTALAADLGPVAWWQFDEGRGSVATDTASGRKDAMKGHLFFGLGVRGSGLRFDGFTSRLVRKASEAPAVAKAFTIEAWVAPQEYSWNWTGIVDQDQDGRGGYSLGINHLGQIGLYASVGDQWVGCLSREPLPLLKWSHVAGTFDPAFGFRLFINGQPAGRKGVRGALVPAQNTDLWIGMSHRQQWPALTERAPSRKFLSNMVFDGLVDEVRIFDRALSPDEIQASFTANRPKEAQPLRFRVMPSGPPGPRPFGAYYTRLEYCPEWDRLWRVGDHADVLVCFDELPVRMVFWRGTGYSPAWVTENGKWVSDQSPESWNEWGCCEHMADKHCRYSHVRILESTEARAVVHWRVASCDINYGFNHVDPDTGWGEWTDEYYYIYPDAVAVRYQEIHSSWAAKMEWQQTQLLNQPGTRPQDNVKRQAITIVNMNGETERWSWEKTYGNRVAESGPIKDGIIQVMNLKAPQRHFVIGEHGARWKPLRFGAREGFSTIPCWNHWPVAQLPNDGRVTPAVDRPSSSCLGTLYPVKHKTDRSDLMFGRNLYGMTAKPADELAVLARSWNRPPELAGAAEGIQSRGYDKNQRAYVLAVKAEEPPVKMELKLAGSEQSPVLNPALVIKNWGGANVKLAMDGNEVPRGKGFRVGHVPTLEGTDLIVWIKCETMKPVIIVLKKN